MNTFQIITQSSRINGEPIVYTMQDDAEGNVQWRHDEVADGVYEKTNTANDDVPYHFTSTLRNRGLHLFTTYDLERHDRIAKNHERELIRENLIEVLENGVLDRPAMNEVLEGLGMRTKQSVYDVTIECDGAMLEFEVNADEECIDDDVDSVEEWVRRNMTVTRETTIECGGEYASEQDEPEYYDITITVEPQG